MNDDRNDHGEDGSGRDVRAERDVGAENGPPNERRDASARARSEPSSPEPDPNFGRRSGPGPQTRRNWLALAVGLAVVSLLTAVAIAAVHGAATAAAGAAVLTVGFAAVAAALVRAPRTAILFADSWAEHRLYVWFATGLFAFGIAIGGLLLAAGVDLTELFLEILLEEFDEEELTGEGGLELSASFFIFQNTPPFLAAIFGALTLGLLTVLIMLVNGVLVGNIAAVAGAEIGIGPILLLLAPHGIFELSALFVAAGIGFRLLHRGVQRIAGDRDALITKAYLSRTVALTVFAWLLLVLAAFVEAYLTEVIAAAVFPEIGE